MRRQRGQDDRGGPCHGKDDDAPAVRGGRRVPAVRRAPPSAAGGYPRTRLRSATPAPARAVRPSAATVTAGRVAPPPLVAGPASSGR